jgi:hypothetical protein
MRFFIVTCFLCTLIISAPASADEMNCTLSQQSNWIDDEGQSYPNDIFMMYDRADSKEECLKLCQNYSEKNIEPNASSFHSIGYTCFYEKKVIEKKQVKVE